MNYLSMVSFAPHPTQNPVSAPDSIISCLKDGEGRSAEKLACPHVKTIIYVARLAISHLQGVPEKKLVYWSPSLASVWPTGRQYFWTTNGRQVLMRGWVAKYWTLFGKSSTLGNTPCMSQVWHKFIFPAQHFPSHWFAIFYLQNLNSKQTRKRNRGFFSKLKSMNGCLYNLHILNLWRCSNILLKHNVWEICQKHMLCIFAINNYQVLSQKVIKKVSRIIADGFQNPVNILAHFLLKCCAFSKIGINRYRSGRKLSF